MLGILYASIKQASVKNANEYCMHVECSVCSINNITKQVFSVMLSIVLYTVCIQCVICINNIAKRVLSVILYRENVKCVKCDIECCIS